MLLVNNKDDDKRLKKKKKRRERMIWLFKYIYIYIYIMFSMSIAVGSNCRRFGPRAITGNRRMQLLNPGEVSLSLQHFNVTESASIQLNFIFQVSH